MSINGSSQSKDGKLSSNIPLDLPSIQTGDDEITKIPKIMTILQLINHAITNQFIQKILGYHHRKRKRQIQKTDNKLNNTYKQCQAFTTNDSFVCSNLQNSAGSCRGAQNLKSPSCQKR